MKHKILVVEDNKDISSIVCKYLEKENYSYDLAQDGFEALEYFKPNKYALVLLDVMMPGIDGFEVLENIRNLSEIPIIMLTARQEEIDRLKGFDLGADDYVVKPFSIKELMKRIKVIIKRTYKEPQNHIYQYQNLKLEIETQKLYKKDQEISITTAEFELLKTLFEHQGQVLSRNQLIEKSFENEYEGYDRSIDTYIKRIRQKIEQDSKHPKYIKTKYGTGYIFGGGNPNDN